MRLPKPLKVMPSIDATGISRWPGSATIRRSGYRNCSSGLSEIEFEPFRLSFDRLEFWARPRVASLTAATVPEELHRVVTALENVLQDEGVVKETRTYRPHITVARNARTFTTERLAQRTSIEWSGFELVESVPGRDGAFYRPLKQ